MWFNNVQINVYQIFLEYIVYRTSLLYNLIVFYAWAGLLIRAAADVQNREIIWLRCTAKI